jgi:hypothetical protein
VSPALDARARLAWLHVAGGHGATRLRLAVAPGLRDLACLAGQQRTRDRGGSTSAGDVAGTSGSICRARGSGGGSDSGA